MTIPTPSTLRTLWFKWKALRLPWRSKYLVGQDLTGNTYWEFVDRLPSSNPNNPRRMRRIVESTNRRIHHSDVQISPQWHQWLRHTRYDAPTLEEQQMDVTRQIQLKHNARLADARWEARAKLVERPKKEEVERPRVTGMSAVQDETGGTGETIRGGDAPKTEPDHKEGKGAVGSVGGGEEEAEGEGVESGGYVAA
ncbi:hypothetical protein LTS08_004871 [Lithohypha guttulata]|uniref:NADH dehydrogenase [ubiquinone] 1 alpha subcomplex subunit n=1 Tax=Lithohypha guttulata TaxID=1690604 RepID=A0AAN7T4I6_9EURO|nr:hypothetical protein LTR05_002285 [Lithohypha guttulata]KAK5101264.1 hypothetical protein LTS08_004871 [Lithohypha guttulata]